MKQIYLSALILFIFSAFIVALSGVLNELEIVKPNPIKTQGIDYQGYVCVTHKNAEGKIISSDCNHNILHFAGQNLTRDYLVSPSATNNITTIALCNISGSTSANCGTPTAGASEAFTSYASCGLTNQSANYAILSPNGNVSVYTTFTSTCNNRMANVTRLQNASGTPFASNTFTDVTLQTNDQLLINWTIMIS